MFKKKQKCYSLAVHPMCFCSCRVKYVCYVPIYSPLNVMEPRDIPEITPPTLLGAFHREFKSSKSNCGLSMHMHIFTPPHPLTPPISISQAAPSAVGVWDGGCGFGRAQIHTSPLSCKEWLLKMQEEGHSAFEIHPLPLPFSLQRSESAALK